MTTRTTTTQLQDVINHAIDGVQDWIDWGQEVPTDEVHQRLFNEDYFIIGYYQAEQWLLKDSIFEAIGKIQEYENFNFGEVTTKLDNSETVANMLAYIKGEEVLRECEVLDTDNNFLTVKQLKTLKEQLEAQL